MEFYDRTGRPRIYSPDRIHLYTWGGAPVAYFHNDHVYTFDGRHLGWLYSGWMIDHQGRRMLFSREATGGPVKPVCAVAPVKSVRQVMPVKGVRAIPPVTPVVGLSWTDSMF